MITDRLTRVSVREGIGSAEESSFGAIVQKYRIKRNMSQSELASMLGTSRNTITNWETDKSLPAFFAIRELVGILEIPLHELFGIDDDDVLSEDESLMLRQYRELSSMSRRVADRMIDALLQEETEARDRDLREHFLVLPLPATPAAAGSGCAFSEAAPTYRFVRKNSRSESADVLIRVSGASMEPLYRDGDLVYVRYGNSADDGEDVVCSTADGAVIKRVRSRRLYSLNQAMPFGDKSEDDHVLILGTVLGIVREDELADESDRLRLEELKCEELALLCRKYEEG